MSRTGLDPGAGGRGTSGDDTTDTTDTDSGSTRDVGLDPGGGGRGTSGDDTTSGSSRSSGGSGGSSGGSSGRTRTRTETVETELSGVTRRDVGPAISPEPVTPGGDEIQRRDVGPDISRAPSQPDTEVTRRDVGPELDRSTTPDAREREQSRIDSMADTFTERVSEPFGRTVADATPAAQAVDRVAPGDPGSRFVESTARTTAELANIPAFAAAGRDLFQAGAETQQPASVGGLTAPVGLPDPEGQRQVGGSAADAAARTAADAASDPVGSAGTATGIVLGGAGLSGGAQRGVRAAQRAELPSGRSPDVDEFLTADRAQADLTGVTRRSVDEPDTRITADDLAVERPGDPTPDPVGRFDGGAGRRRGRDRPDDATPPTREPDPPSGDEFSMGFRSPTTEAGTAATPPRAESPLTDLRVATTQPDTAASGAFGVDAGASGIAGAGAGSQLLDADGELREFGRATGDANLAGALTTDDVDAGVTGLTASEIASGFGVRAGTGAGATSDTATGVDTDSGLGTDTAATTMLDAATTLGARSAVAPREGAATLGGTDTALSSDLATPSTTGRTTTRPPGAPGTPRPPRAPRTPRPDPDADMDADEEPFVLAADDDVFETGILAGDEAFEQAFGTDR